MVLYNIAVGRMLHSIFLWDEYCGINIFIVVL